MLRTFYKSDLEQLLAVEQSASVTPWGRETFLICFQEGYVGWVMEVDARVIGFVIASMRAEECHILNLCVRRDFQHQGMGRQLLEHVLKYARQQRVGMAYLEVRRSNLRAIALYQKEEFQLIGERKNYYPIASGFEDALIYAKSLHLATPYIRPTT